MIRWRIAQQATRHTTNPTQNGYSKLSCAECREGAGLDFDFTMAFQPIVDLEKGRVFAQEALVRGANGEGAGIAQVCDELSIRVIAEGIETAEELKPLRDFGITLFQGYHFARPQFEGLAPIAPEHGISGV